MWGGFCDSRILYFFRFNSFGFFSFVWNCVCCRFFPVCHRLGFVRDGSNFGGVFGGVFASITFEGVNAAHERFHFFGMLHNIEFEQLCVITQQYLIALQFYLHTAICQFPGEFLFLCFHTFF